jgi:hypothetical protein
MKDLKRTIVGVASLGAVILVGLFATQMITGETLALFAVLLGLSATIGAIVGKSMTPQKTVASMLRDEVDAPRSPTR